MFVMVDYVRQMAVKKFCVANMDHLSTCSSFLLFFSFCLLVLGYFCCFRLEEGGESPSKISVIVESHISTDQIGNVYFKTSFYLNYCSSRDSQTVNTELYSVSSVHRKPNLY